MRFRPILGATAFAALLAVAAPAFAQADAAPPRPFTYQDMLGLNRVSDPQVSPDGRHVAYAVRATDMDANRGVTSLYILDLEADGEPRRLAVSDLGANTARWGSDGALYFLSGRSGFSQVWKTDVQGASATQVTDLPLDVQTYRLSPDAGRVAVALAVHPDCPTLACTVEKNAEREAAPATGQAHDRLFVRHWDTWADGTRNRLYVVPTDGSAEPLAMMAGVDGDTPSRPFGDEGDFTFTPDGQELVYSVRIAGNSEPWSTNFDLYRTVTAPDGTVTHRNLTEDNPAWDAGPVFSPDGRTLAWRAMARPGFEADRWQIVLMDTASGEKRHIAANWDRSADSLQWANDGRTLYVTAQDTGSVRLFAIDVASGRVAPVTGPGHVAGVGLTPSGFVLALDSLNAPVDLYAKTYLGREMPRRLTDHNPVLAERAFGEYEQFSFAGWNDATVHGYVIKPANYVEGQRYPVAFLIHGGPQGSFGDSWSWRWNPATYAGAGYAVVMIDFHGSIGYGQAFTDAISQHWGDRPLEDLKKGWAAALDRYDFLDGTRACALGASYGGYMINWIAGNWNDAFQCAVNHAGILDTRFMGYSTEELWFTEWENGGTPWERGATYDRFNPVNHVNNWRTPTLVVHGALDYRVPLDQGVGTFTALQRKGIDSRMVVFPDENHWILKPQNSLQWHNEVFGWLDRHIGEGAD